MSGMEESELGALEKPLQASGRTLVRGSHASGSSDESQARRAGAHLSPEAGPHDASGSQSPPSFTHTLSRQSRLSVHVRWQAIDGACAEVLSFEAEPDIGVPLSFASGEQPPEDDEGCCERYCWLCAGLRDFWRERQERRSAEEVEAFAFGRPLKDGLLWKLNSDVDTDVEQMQDWTSWRCRHFFMSRSEGKLGLLYISEKQNGYMQLGAILHDFRDSRHNEIAGLKEIEPVSLIPMSTQSTLRLGKTLHDYDLAFSEKEMYSTDEQYVREIPDKLYVIEITWKDYNKKSHTLHVGAKTSKDRVIWLKSMRIAMGLGG